MSEDNQITLSGNLRTNDISPSMSALMLNVRKLEGERTELQKENAQLKRANQDRYHENLRLRSWLAQHEQSTDYARGYADGMAEREAAAANEPVADCASNASLAVILERAAQWWWSSRRAAAIADRETKLAAKRAADEQAAAHEEAQASLPVTEQHAALHNAIRPKR